MAVGVGGRVLGLCGGGVGLNDVGCRCCAVLGWVKIERIGSKD